VLIPLIDGRPNLTSGCIRTGDCGSEAGRHPVATSPSQDALNERGRRRGQEQPVSDHSDEAVVGIEPSRRLGFQDQLATRDVWPAVGERVRNVKFLAKKIDERPQFDHGHTMRSPVLPEKARFYELGPGHGPPLSWLRAQHRPVAAASALAAVEPVVKR
jgi:hypothetical protein